MAVVKVELV